MANVLSHSAQSTNDEWRRLYIKTYRIVWFHVRRRIACSHRMSQSWTSEKYCEWKHEIQFSKSFFSFITNVRWVRRKKKCTFYFCELLYNSVRFHYDTPSVHPRTIYTNVLWYSGRKDKERNYIKIYNNQNSFTRYLNKNSLFFFLPNYFLPNDKRGYLFIIIQTDEEQYNFRTEQYLYRKKIRLKLLFNRWTRVPSVIFIKTKNETKTNRTQYKKKKKIKSIPKLLFFHSRHYFRVYLFWYSYLYTKIT